MGPRVGPVVFKRKNLLAPPGFKPWTVQAVASRCTDYAFRIIIGSVIISFTALTYGLQNGEAVSFLFFFFSVKDKLDF